MAAEASRLCERKPLAGLLKVINEGKWTYNALLGHLLSAQTECTVRRLSDQLVSSGETLVYILRGRNTKRSKSLSVQVHFRIGWRGDACPLS